MSTAIRFSNVSKRYRKGAGLPRLFEALGATQDLPPDQVHWAVKDVSFELEKGQSLGIIGPNGAGKTTILKLLSKVTNASSGHMEVNGRLSALLELGAGFHPDLTGRDNVYLNGAILGMRKAEIRARFDQIVEFAGIKDFLDTPVKRYSSGMYARLGFAIAAHVDPDVLLVDEVLAVGDYAFQQKCHARMDELRQNGTSLILVAHNMDAIRRVCTHGLVMYRGENIFMGSSADAILSYTNAVRAASRAMQEEKSFVPVDGGVTQRVITFDAEIKHVELRNTDNQPISALQSGDSAIVAMDIAFNKAVSQPIFAFYVRTIDGRVVYSTTTRQMKLATRDFAAGETCHVEFAITLPLLEGFYELGVNVTPPSMSHFYDILERALEFWVDGGNGAEGIADFNAEFSMSSDAVGDTQPILSIESR